MTSFSPCICPSYAQVRAAKVGDLEGVQEALQRGGQTDGGGGTGRQALHEASDAGRVEVVRLLLTHKAQVNSRSKKHGDQGESERMSKGS